MNYKQQLRALTLLIAATAFPLLPLRATASTNDEPYYVADPVACMSIAQFPKGFDTPLHWTRYKFPLKVYIDSSMPESLIYGAEWAAEHWNRSLGFRALETILAPSIVVQAVRYVGGSITVSKDPLPENVIAVARTWARPANGRIVRTWISYNSTGIIYYPSNTMVHELGHALGMEHDKNSSVMYWQQINTDLKIPNKYLEYVRSTYYNGKPCVNP